MSEPSVEADAVADPRFRGLILQIQVEDAAEGPAFYSRAFTRGPDFARARTSSSRMSWTGPKCGGRSFRPRHRRLTPVPAFGVQDVRSAARSPRRRWARR